MVLLTGATGFVGCYLLTKLLENNINVKALILPNEKIPFSDPNIEWVKGDICNIELLIDVFVSIDSVIHLAGLVANPDEKLNHKVNYLGTKNLVDLGIQKKIKRFIFMSAAAVKFKNKNAYGKTKKMAEDYVIESEIPYTILRTPLIIGRNCYEFKKFVDYINMIPNIVVVFGDGQCIKRPIYIDDVILTIMKIYDNRDSVNKIYEISCIEKITLDEFIDIIIVAFGQTKWKIHIPLKLSLIMAGLSEIFLGNKSSLTRDMLLGLNENVDFDTKESCHDLNITPMPISDAVSKCI
jgi:NADH dehydrogenase